jgi:hypothetical protein
MMTGSQKRRKGAGRLQGQLWSFKLHHYRDLQRFDNAAILARPFFWLTSSVGLSGVAKSRHREPRRHPDQHERPEREIAAVMQPQPNCRALGEFSEGFLLGFNFTREGCFGGWCWLGWNPVIIASK